MGGEEYFPSFQKAVYRRQRRRWLNETGQPKVVFPPFSSPRMVYKIPLKFRKSIAGAEALCWMQRSDLQPSIGHLQPLRLGVI